MSEVIRLVPNPSGDHKVLKFESDLLDLLEEVYENLADKHESIRHLSTLMLEGVPVDRVVLESLIEGTGEELPKIVQLLQAVRSRKAAIQRALKDGLG